MNLQNVFVKGWYKNWSAWLLIFMFIASVIEQNMHILPHGWVPYAVGVTFAARIIQQSGLLPAFIASGRQL